MFLIYFKLSSHGIYYLGVRFTYFLIPFSGQIYFLFLFFLKDVLKKSKARAQLQFAFHLIQIWNVYFELHYHGDSGNLDNEAVHPSAALKPITVIKEFWSKIPPDLYSLLQHSQKVLFFAINKFFHTKMFFI